MHISKSQPLLTFTVVLSIAALIQRSAAEPAPSGELHNASYSEMPALQPEKLIESFAPVAEKVGPAVVRIVTGVTPNNSTEAVGDIPDPLQRYLPGQVVEGQSRRPLPTGLGSGVVVSEDGYILTNGHLIAGANEVEVTLQDGREFKATVIGFDAVTDVAVIKINAQHLTAMTLADSRNVRVGDVVLAVGYPFGVGQTVTHGIVSATDRGGMGIEDYESFIQTDAPINPGNSGGALVNLRGGLVGINTAILSSSGGNLGIGFAIPSNLARSVLADLVKYGCVKRGYLGIEAQNLTSTLAKEFHLDFTPGALVGGVVPESPAQRAGIQVGDVITRMDGKPVQDARQLRFAIAEARPNQKILIELLRDGAAKALCVTLSQVPDRDLASRSEWSPEPDNSGVLQGVVLIELSSQIRQHLRIPGDVRGAVVLDLHAYSVAAQAGLRPGDVIESVNRKEVSNTEDVSRLTQNDGQKRALLRVWSQGGSRFIVVEN